MSDDSFIFRISSFCLHSVIPIISQLQHLIPIKSIKSMLFAKMQIALFTGITAVAYNADYKPIPAP